IMNSINMLDNMDSITNLTALGIIAGATVYSFLTNGVDLNFISFVTIASVGAMLSFLIYNWNPAKMYMGDSGSQFLGTLLAFIGILYLWNSVPIADYSYGYNTKQIIIVALAFVIPISDTTTVTINRLLKKKSPFVGGRDHTTHFLAYLGVHERWIAILYFSLTIGGNLIAYYLIGNKSEWNTNLFWLYTLIPFTIFILLYINTKITKPK
ncbi:MAG TPA: MraY family glycosyltransferase, partial [Bacteroidales bacterium]|nr:MraY family glycosyltransferase [Bacteroidales bacterium]